MEGFFDQLAVSAAASSAVLVAVGLLIWFSDVFQHVMPQVLVVSSEQSGIKMPTGSK